MPITFTEDPDSRQITTGENASAVLKYTLRGTSNEVTANTLVSSSTATTYMGLVRQSMQCDPVVTDTVNDTGQWAVTVRYGVRPAPSETNEPTYQFDTGGGTQHITQSISSSGRYGLLGPNSCANCYGAIGVTDDNVDGVDITVPVYNWSETHYLTDAQVNRAAYYALTGKVNNAAWNGFAAGEVLFLGASGSKRGNGNWEITFKFAASPNKTNIVIGSTGWSITVASKKGWEYMWVSYKTFEDGTAKVLTKKPIGVYVEKVYDDGDFSVLPTGGT